MQSSYAIKKKTRENYKYQTEKQRLEYKDCHRKIEQKI